MEKKSIFKKQAPATKGAYTPQLPTFLVVLESYELGGEKDVIVGKRFDNGEPVRISLKPASNEKETAQFVNRTDISEFAAPRKLTSTEPGGIFIVESPVKVGENEYEARWIRAASKYPGEAHIIMGRTNLTRPRPTAAGNGKEFQTLTVICDGKNDDLPDDIAEGIRYHPTFDIPADQLHETVEQMLDNGYGVGVRVITADNSGFEAQSVRPRKDKTGKELAEDFIKRIGGQEFLNSAKDEGVKFEIIPIMNLFMGPEVMKTYKVNPTRIAELERFNKNGETVFSPAYIAVRKLDDGKGKVGFIVTSVVHQNGIFNDNEISSKNYYEALNDSIAYAQTDFFKPDNSKFNTANRAQVAEEIPGDDMEFDGSDLMGAAAGEGEEPARSGPRP